MAISTPDRPEDTQDAMTDAAASTRRILFVAGSGRSGTSTFVGIVRQLGMHVPEPEVVADHTNPRGFGEPQWVVDVHIRLLKRACVQMSDARPEAWAETAKLGERENIREELNSWLRQQLELGVDLVIKDPRLSWFLEPWRDVANRAQAEACFATMLRPPTEVVGSKRSYYGMSDLVRNKYTNGIAAWVNMMLHTERATRGSKRIFVRYHDLLDDWTGPVFRAAEQLDLPVIKTAAQADIQRVHDFIDPSLRRIQLTWEDTPIPSRLRELASETWDQINILAERDGDNSKTHEQLDRLMDEYVTFYEDAEAIARSSIVTARQQVKRKMASNHTQSKKTSTSRKLASRIPHRVRAVIPAQVRRWAKRAARIA